MPRRLLGNVGPSRSLPSRNGPEADCIPDKTSLPGSGSGGKAMQPEPRGFPARDTGNTLPRRDSIPMPRNGPATRTSPMAEPCLAAGYLIKKVNLSKFFKAMPVPRATARRGSSAKWTGNLVFAAIRLSSPRSKEPPPAR